MAERPQRKVAALGPHGQSTPVAAQRETPSSHAAFEQPSRTLPTVIDTLQQAQAVAALLQTATGALHDIRLVLQRMRALVMLAGNSGLTASDRGTIRTQLDELFREVDRLATSAERSTQQLLDGSLTAAVISDAVADVSPALAFTVATTAAALGLGGTDVLPGNPGFDVPRERSTLETAIDIVSTQLAELGVAFLYVNGMVANLRFESGASTVVVPISDPAMATAVTRQVTAQMMRQHETALQAQASALQGVLLRFPKRPPAGCAVILSPSENALRRTKRNIGDIGADRRKAAESADDTD